MARTPFELKGKTVFVAGHRGMVGGALVRRLAQEDVELLTVARSEVDLRDQAAVTLVRRQSARRRCFWRRPRSAASSPTTRCAPNSSTTIWSIATNVIHAAHVNGVEKLMFLGSSCIYPKLAPQPMREDSLLTGPLEPTNEPYAIAKIAGIKMVEAYRSQYGSDFISVMPTNLYGPRRQLSSRIQPRRRRADPPLSRGQGIGRRQRRGVGHRHAAPGIPLCRRSRRRLHSPDEDLFQRRTGQHRHRRGHHASPNSPAGGRDRRLHRRRSASIPRGPTARRANCSMSAGWQNWAGAPAPRSRMASGSPTRRI